jgi:chorismate mutase
MEKGNRGGPEWAEIDALRRRIDELDERLVRLLNERAGCALSIGRLKQALGLEIFQPERERDVLRHVRELNGGPLDEHAIVRLFERIIDENRRLERLAQGRSAKGEG